MMHHSTSNPSYFLMFPFSFPLTLLLRCFQVFEQLCRGGHVSSFCDHGGLRLISRAVAGHRGGASLLRHNALSCAAASAPVKEIVQTDWPNSDILSLLVELSMSVHSFSNFNYRKTFIDHCPILPVLFSLFVQARSVMAC